MVEPAFFYNILTTLTWVFLKIHTQLCCIYFKAIICTMNFFTELSLKYGKSKNTLLSWQFVNVQVLFCSMLRIIFFSQLLLTAPRGKTCLDLWFKNRSNVSNTCCYQSHFKQLLPLLPWKNQVQNRGDFRHWSFTAVLPARFPLRPHCSNRLKPSCFLPKIRYHPAHSRANMELIRWYPSQCLLTKDVPCSVGFSNPAWASSSTTCNTQR